MSALTIINGVLISIILIMFVFLLVNSNRKRIDLFGKPPIPRIFFVAGKIGNFGCWYLFIHQLNKSFFAPYAPALPFFILSTAALLLATVLIVASFIHLGDFNRFGLPSDETSIIRKGIYSFSRNPMYLGFDLFNISSIFYYPHWVNIVLGTVGIVVHHFIALAEEKYMLKAFGEKWMAYRSKVRRYF